MHEEYIAVVEFGEQVFRAAAEMLDSAAREVLHEAARERDAQIRTARFNRDEARMFHGRGKAPADGFDLGEFGHSRFTMRQGPRAATIAPGGAPGYGLPRCGQGWRGAGDSDR
jgi:hypothetical protein